MTLAVYTDYSYYKAIKYLDYRFKRYAACIALEGFTTFEDEYPGVEL